MDENVFFLIDEKLKSEVELKCFGIKIRNINKEEFEYIKEKIKSLYCSQKLKKLYEKYTRAKETNKISNNIDELKEANETLTSILDLKADERRAFYYLENNNGNIDLSKLGELKKCIVAEVNEEKFKKCFGDLDKKSVILKILLFANYLKVDDYKNTKVYYSILKEFKDYEHILDNDYKDNNIDITYLDKIAVALNNKDINFNISFFFIIENLIFNNMSLESKIVNLVSVIEKLLIKKGENKQQSFVLKVGILIKEYMAWSNQEISDVLKTIYEIRSLIVHGEEEKIYEQKGRVKEIFKEDNLDTLEDKVGVRNEIFLIITSYLEIITRMIINRYIEDTEFCEYIRMN